MRITCGLLLLGLMACPAGPTDSPDAGARPPAADTGQVVGDDAGSAPDVAARDQGSTPGEDGGVVAPDAGSPLVDAGGPPGDERCGGIAGFMCQDRDNYCDQPEGQCRVADGMGVCRAVPEACDDQWLPVCGCDGATYGNDCERLMARAQLSHTGACEDAPPDGECGGFIGRQCPGENDFCEHPQGNCQVADGVGQCVRVPRQCGREFEPVCGCDGETYDNDCRRLQAGVQLDYQGECAEAPPRACQSNEECGPQDFCAKETDACDAAGTCQARPEACIGVVQPVCGCDLRDYSNGCVAHSQGVNIFHEGACRD